MRFVEDISAWEYARGLKQQPNCRMERAYLDMCNHAFSDGRKTDLQAASLEFLHCATGRKRWLIDCETAKAIASLKFESTKTSELVLPYDAFSIHFEHGFEVSGLPVRWLRLGTARSPLAQKICADAGIPVFPFSIIFTIDCGEGLNGIRAWDTPSPTAVLNGGIVINEVEHENIITNEVFPEQKENLAFPFAPIAISGADELIDSWARNFIIAMLLLWRARPEFLRPIYLSASANPKIKQGRNEAYRLNMMPLNKGVSMGQLPKTAIGIERAAHFRGWVLRTLRHPKFKRNSDGSTKVVLVPPCVIHPEKMQNA